MQPTLGQGIHATSPSRVSGDEGSRHFLTNTSHQHPTMPWQWRDVRSKGSPRGKGHGAAAHDVRFVQQIFVHEQRLSRSRDGSRNPLMQSNGLWLGQEIDHNPA